MATAGTATILATGTLTAASEMEGESTNPLANITYNNKVLDQATWDEYHGFPESVDAFGADGTQSEIVGGDGITRTKIQIPGDIWGKRVILNIYLSLIIHASIECLYQIKMAETIMELANG